MSSFNLKESERKLTVLHICNNFFGSKLYENLFNNLENFGIKSYVLVIVPNNEEVKNSELMQQKYKYIKIIKISNYLDIVFRFVPIIRMLYIFKCLQDYKSKSVNIIQSHTLHSNGTIGECLANI